MDISPLHVCYDAAEPAMDCTYVGGQVVSEYKEHVNPWDYRVMGDPYLLFDLTS